MAGSSAREERLEQILLPVLMVAFGAAAGVTLAGFPASSPGPAFTETAEPRPFILPDAPPGFLKMTVADVVVSEGAAQSAVLISGPAHGVVLPLFIPSEAGERLQSSLDFLSFDTPAALQEALAQTGGDLLRVQLTQGPQGPSGTLVMSREGDEQELEIGLAEALSVAVAKGATIWVARALVDAQAIETNAIPTPVGVTASHVRPPALL